MHSVLIVGCGSIGERHLRCFQLTKRAAVTACDTNPLLLATMQEKYGVRTMVNWQEALAGGAFTAAVICTPAPLHLPMALPALTRGIHVLIEKPLSHSLARVDELIQAAKQSQAAAAVAYVFHQFPTLRAAKEVIASGELGPVLQVVTASGQPFHRLRPGYAQSYYRDRASGGGAIQDALTHTANWVESVVGPTESVMCDCSHQALPDVAVEDTVHVSTRNGGVLVNYSISQFQSPNENFLQFNAARGSVRVELHQQRWGIWREGDPGWVWHSLPVPDRDSHFIAQANAFLDRIEGKPANLCSIEAAAQTLRFNLAALASAETHRRVYCHELHA
ncbi:MAG: Gfo/Idh/MocA family oxidoreductase [Opitutaceae bacterium]|nr:Gfo/Idh/MocA family oxidoreductase [Opitutaceae bacterium]